jgi:hypothetical protein
MKLKTCAGWSSKMQRLVKLVSKVVLNDPRSRDMIIVHIAYFWFAALHEASLFGGLPMLREALLQAYRNALRL